MEDNNIIQMAELFQSLNHSLRYDIFSDIYLSDAGDFAHTIKDDKGNNILDSSVSFSTAIIPQSQIDLLQKAIQILHEWSDDIGIPKDKRDLCKDFSLPDPIKCPDAYRLTGPFWNRHLHVNWLFSNCSEKPISEYAKLKNWSDYDERMDFGVALKHNILQKIFTVKRIVTAIISLLLFFICFYIIFLIPRYCPDHKIKCGRGIFLNTENECPKRCTLTNCNYHLNADGYCTNPSHICKICHKNQPLSPEKEGVCDKCFLKVR